VPECLARKPGFYSLKERELRTLGYGNLMILECKKFAQQVMQFMKSGFLWFRRNAQVGGEPRSDPQLKCRLLLHKIINPNAYIMHIITITVCYQHSLFSQLISSCFVSSSLLYNSVAKQHALFRDLREKNAPVSHIY